MKTHILFIDNLEKLSIKKDSTLLLALTLKEMGYKVCLIFEESLYFSNIQKTLKISHFEGSYSKEDFYILDFKVLDFEVIELNSECIFHMRLDPPFDARYLRYLWILESLKNYRKIQVINDSKGILTYNEKLVAYQRSDSIESFVGTSKEDFKIFIDEVKKSGTREVIIKPLDLFQGIGVKKFLVEDESLLDLFLESVKIFKGPVIVQPFKEEVLKGEIRSLFFRSEHLGTILKVPPKGNFLANIVQGAEFSEHELSREMFSKCQSICNEMAKEGIYFIAFDILADSISEVNITCPGLLVEVSYAVKENLAKKIIELI